MTRFPELAAAWDEFSKARFALCDRAGHSCGGKLQELPNRFWFPCQKREHDALAALEAAVAEVCA